MKLKLLTVLMIFENFIDVVDIYCLYMIYMHTYVYLLYIINHYIQQPLVTTSKKFIYII